MYFLHSITNNHYVLIPFFRYNARSQLEYGDATCPFDFVVLADGKDPVGGPPIGGKICGSPGGVVQQSTGNTLYIRFQSDGSYTYNGFSAYISVTT